MAARTVLTAWLSLVLAASAASEAESLLLVEDGTPKATIVVPKHASPTERFAAEELQRYIKEMSNATLPIASDETPPEGAFVSVGKTALAKPPVVSEMPGPDPYVIKTSGPGLILLGKGDRGTIYSAYHFLERHCGCRWVFPGPLGNIIPQHKTLRVGPIDEFHEPDFRFRICSGFNTADCRDWAIKHRMHIWSSSPKQWADEEMIKRGGCVMGTMHHAFHGLFPPEKHFGKHPEYYGLIAGKRIAAKNRGQLCLANPDVVRLTAEQAIRFFDENPNADYFSLCPDDHQNWCECESCRAYDSTTMERWGRTFPIVTDRLMAFVNKVAERLERKHPGKMIYVFAYQNYTAPPLKHMPRGNVIVSLCHMVPACYAHPLEDPDCEKNVAFMELLTGWSSIHKNMWYYAYTCKSMWQDMPWPIAHRLAKDIRTLHKQGFQGFYSQGSGMRWGQLGVNMYVMGKVLWDVDTDVDAVLDEYFTSSFGPAATPMQSYYALLEKQFSQPGIYIHHEAREQAPQFLTPEVFAKCFAYLDEAERKANGDEKVLARIKPVRIAFEYAKLYLDANKHEKAFRESDSDDDLQKALDTYLQIINLHKEHGRHAISSGSINRYVRKPLEKLQTAQFTRTGEAPGLDIQWDTKNLLANPSFEEGDGAALAHWKGIGKSSRGASMVTQEQAHSGNWSILMQAKKQTDVPDATGFWKADWVAAGVFSPKIPVKKGDICRLLVWVNIPEPFTDTKRGVILNIVGYDKNGKSPPGWRAGSVEARRTKPTTGWQRLALFREIDNPAITAVAARIGIAGSGRVFFDDIELVTGKKTR